MVEFEQEVYIYVQYSKYTLRQKLRLILSILTGKEVEYSDVVPIEYEPDSPWC